MEGIEALRNAVESIAKNRAGKAKKQPHQFAVQTNASDFIHIIMSLPVDNAEWEPLQDPATGLLYYVSGASPLGRAPLGG